MANKRWLTTMVQNKVTFRHLCRIRAAILLAKALLAYQYFQRRGSDHQPCDVYANSLRLACRSSCPHFSCEFHRS